MAGTAIARLPAAWPGAGRLIPGLDAMVPEIDNVESAVIALAGNGEIVATNDAARRVFSDGDGLFQIGRSLVASRAADTKALADRIAEATTDSPYLNRPAFTVVSVARPSGLLPYLVLIVPIAAVADQSESGADRDDPAILVLVEELEPPAGSKAIG
jgi:hypothetical protein